MKRRATFLLLVAAGVYVAATLVGARGAWGYVQAGSGAAMVGGLADWFAVTALFRRPLGLPIPHTALVPRKKDELATKLGEFVTGHFLTPSALQEQLAEREVVSRAGEWLADPAHSRRLAGELASGAAAAIGALDPEVVVDYVVELLKRDQARRSYAPVLGRLLDRALDAGAPAPLIDVLVSRTRSYLEEHQAELHPTLKRFVEERHWVAWLVTTDRVIDKFFRDAIAELAQIETDADHPLRLAMERIGRQVAADLRSDPATAAAVDRVAARLLDDVNARRVLRDAVVDGVESIRASLAERSATVVDRVASLLSGLGGRAVADPELHDRLEGWLRDAAGTVVVRYGGELTTLIRRQVAAWPAASASQRIELAVGRDLQYIRVNGTVVGALAGLVIHAVGALLA